MACLTMELRSSVLIRCPNCKTLLPAIVEYISYITDDEYMMQGDFICPQCVKHINCHVFVENIDDTNHTKEKE